MIIPGRNIRLTALLLVGFIVAGCGSLRAQEDFYEEDAEFLPGIVATFSSSGNSFRRIDPSIRYAADSSDHSERLATQGPVKIQWSGLLYARPSGSYTFRAHGNTSYTVEVAGKALMHGEADEPNPAAWSEPAEIELSFGMQPVTISVEHSTEQASFGLYWSGPGFALEPVNPRHCFHPVESTIEDLYAQGKSLARQLRCAGCHQFGSDRKSLSAPSLTHLQGNLRPSWMVEHLQASSAVGGRKMPLLGLDRNSALAISASLFAASADPGNAPNSAAEWTREKSRRKSKDDQEDGGSTSSASEKSERGRALFASIGCIACHQAGELGQAPPGTSSGFEGNDLSRVSTKHTRDFFERLLVDPRLVNEQHRMPLFQLSARERTELVAFLISLGAEESRNDTRAAGDQGRGGGLIARHRCGACHQLPPKLVQPVARTQLGPQSDWLGGCLGPPRPRAAVPGYDLTAKQREALKTYIIQSASRGGPKEKRATGGGPEILAENNCLNCHRRDGAVGNAGKLTEAAKQLPELAARLAALAPPSLTSVGDKLHADALKRAIRRDGPALRDWLSVRMPKYRLTPEQVDALANYFDEQDRIPPGLSQPSWELKQAKSTASANSDAEPDQLLPKQMQLAAARLVTADGFGCQSCHPIGGAEAPKVDLKARGTELAMLGQRIREPWFHRWLKNPARIVPRMEMPAITTAATGLLHDSLDLQREALWQTLNSPDFVPPKPNPVTVVRARNMPDVEEPIRILTDVIETETQTYLRPLVVGFSHRHNVMLDLEHATLAAWWLGDTARQQTRGKTWFWEIGGQQLSDQELMQLHSVDADGRVWRPAARQQYALDLNRMDKSDSQLSWEATLHLQSGQRWREATLQQSLEPTASGFQVRTTVLGLDGHRLRLQLPASARQDARRFSVQLPVEEDTADLAGELAEFWLEAVTQGGEARHEWVVNFSSRIAADSFPTAPPAPVAGTPVELDIVPGYTAVKLPLPRRQMPISFAWGPDGQLFMGSLKGGIFEVVDSDDDGLLDRYDPISENFPTPYGMYAGADYLDVLTKFGLYRLTNRRDGVFASTTVLSDDWGYSHDYHDWAVGLERDDHGAYYIALPCQQDDRSAAAARRRGTAIRLIPPQAGAEETRYRCEEISAGLRFPMGIALSPKGELFTTDNQGNYNPFNELNHLRPGKRYGFINKLENKDGFSPPFEEPAINIPHPWTRSVNGICFLEPPAGVKPDIYGPFRGHLIGCEMNGRSLIRLSLQRVGDTFQGAAYPFSQSAPDGQPTFEGPIVCEVAPSGDLYVGNLHDSGWGGGQNTGSIVRVRPAGQLPPGIAEVRANAGGFVINFTQPVDSQRAADPAAYQIRSYRRVSTPAYGGDDQDARNETVREVLVRPDATSCVLRLDDLREGFVYEINVGMIAEPGQTLFPSQAHYSLNKIPPQ